MIINPKPKKILILGSGPIVIGQAAEFDYSGSQACKAIREEGIKVIVLNPNPATIQTDFEMADIVYSEPLIPEVVERIFEKEKPDGIIASMGGQSGLNLVHELHKQGILEKYGVKLLGTEIDGIIKGEDRDEFKKTMLAIGEPCIESIATSSLSKALEFADAHEYPLIVRPAYTLGGTGGGKATNREELIEIFERGIVLSPVKQVLVERDVSGWAEIEYEVMRDSNNNCITICNMENIDPMGVHTGESIVVAPCQTLSDEDIQMLRTSSLKIIRELQIVGGCNVQFALNQETGQYYVIEVNPRLSRSSALASKATGYPIARVAAKLALGYSLDQVENRITGTTAGFEPTLDYVVLKIPKWPFYKLPWIERSIGTQMKSTGEVMAIGRTFEEAINKAFTSLEMKIPAIAEENIGMHLTKPTDLRIFAILEAFRLGKGIEEIYSLTKINRWFLHKLYNMAKVEQKIRTTLMNPGLIREAKRMGFSDNRIAKLTDGSESSIRETRLSAGITTTYKMVDSCGGEFHAKTPYFYSTYESSSEVPPCEKKKIMVIGSGPIRIGQGIEFDYCCVHSSIAIQEMGFESIMVNNNPETVSTDFDTSNRLYFEPITVESIQNIVDAEGVDGIIVQFGGQTSIDIAVNLQEKYAAKILGTSIKSIDIAEDREKFRDMLIELGIRQPENGIATNIQKALEVAKRISYPVVVRPSYVIAGRAMEIVFNDDELKEYMAKAVDIGESKPILIDRFIDGIECEADAVCDGEQVFIGGIMEHVEKSGIHSGDAFSVVPSVSLSDEILKELVECTKKITLALGIKGMINLQYIVKDRQIFVLEANPRASRTVPYLSKATGYPMAKIATMVMLGKKLKDLKLPDMPIMDRYAVKGVVFPFIKLKGLDYILGPEMKSTGESMGIAKDFDGAYLKAMLAANPLLINVIHAIREKKQFGVAVSLSERTKETAQELFGLLRELGAEVYATDGTAKVMGGEITVVPKISENKDYNFVTLIRKGQISMLINTPKKGNKSYTDGFKMRRAAVEGGIPCLTTMEAALALLRAIKKLGSKKFEVLDISSN